MLPDGLDAAVAQHRHQVDQPDQGAQHAEGGREGGHDAEHLGFGLFAGAQARHAPLQQFDDLVFGRVVDDQLHACAQEGVGNLLELLFDLADIGVHPQLGHRGQFFDVALLVVLVVAEDGAHQLEDAYHLR
ncbi:hypothetical protein D9M68_653630 [compost metagenome]